MARPRGSNKTARVIVNLGSQVPAAMATIAGREDVPAGQLARTAVKDYLAREEPSVGQTVWPLARSTAKRAEGHGR